MSTKAIPKRSEVPAEDTWDLSDIFPSEEAWQAEFEALKALPEKAAAFRGTLGKSAADLLAWFRMQDDVSVRLTKLHGYANCHSDEDTADSHYVDMKSRAMSVIVAISAAASFATPEIMAIPEETLQGFLKAEPKLEEYRRSLYLIRRSAEHILSPESEALLAAAGEMADAADNIGSTLRNADMRFPAVTDASGAERALTNGTLTTLLEDPDPDFRRRVFDAYYDRLGEYRNTIAATLDGQFKQLRFFAGARHYGSTLEAALFGNEIPTEVYLNLIEAVHQNLPAMYRYVALRKKLLKLPELHMCDVYTPIVADAAQEIPFAEAKATVLEALAVLGEDYVSLLKEGFEHRWIDVYENVGKRSGAYSSGNAYPHPYVLLNHKDNLDSMFTLAHEMGHALHSYHSCAAQPVSTADYVIFVAEVASTVNEVLLMRRLLARTTEKKARAYLINHFLDQFKGTIYRQTMFAEFELLMGRMAEAGEALTADALSEKYLELNKLYFGPDMISDPGIALEWARIPHFFYNYYVFQYATGFSAAVAIAERILSLGESAVADYKRFLSGGSSTDPISLLKIAGVDMSTPRPVNDALKLFDELVSELEALDL